MIDRSKYDKWFGRVRREFSPAAMPFAGKPIVYVEIGTWAGAATEWICKNILTHDKSRGFGIDPYDQSRERRRWDVEDIRIHAANRVAAAVGDRFQWIREPSSTGLITLRQFTDRIDLLYIDGLHEAPDVVADFTLAWPLLKEGSIVIFDDYQKGHGYVWPHVKEACAAIELAYRWVVQPITFNRQYSLRVIRKDMPTLKQRSYPPEKTYKEIALRDLSRKGLLL